MSEGKSIALGQVFTDEQLLWALRIVNTGRTAQEIVSRIEDEITKPALQHINQVTGQENDARYWAYLLVHTLARK